MDLRNLPAEAGCARLTTAAGLSSCGHQQITHPPCGNTAVQSLLPGEHCSLCVEALCRLQQSFGTVAALQASKTGTLSFSQDCCQVLWHHYVDGFLQTSHPHAAQQHDNACCIVSTPFCTAQHQQNSQGSFQCKMQSAFFWIKEQNSCVVTLCAAPGCSQEHLLALKRAIRVENNVAVAHNAVCTSVMSATKCMHIQKSALQPYGHGLLISENMQLGEPGCTSAFLST